jgi:hypothetical protein
LRSQRLLDAGKLDVAEQHFQELFSSSERLRVPLAASYYHAQSLALNFERTGRISGSAMNEPPYMPTWALRLSVHRIRRIRLDLEHGALDHALREFRLLEQSGFAAVSDEAFALYNLVQLAGVAIDLQQLDAARRLHELLAPHASLIALSAFSLSRGCVARYLGLLDVSLGRWQLAREHFQHASEVNARSGHELQRLHSQLGLALCLVRSEAGSGLDQGRSVATKVAESAEALGAGALATSARELLQQLEPEPGRGLTSAHRRSSQLRKSQRKRPADLGSGRH